MAWHGPWRTVTFSPNDRSLKHFVETKKDKYIKWQVSTSFVFFVETNAFSTFKSKQHQYKKGWTGSRQTMSQIFRGRHENTGQPMNYEYIHMLLDFSYAPTRFSKICILSKCRSFQVRACPTTRQLKHAFNWSTWTYGLQGPAHFWGVWRVSTLWFGCIPLMQTEKSEVSHVFVKRWFSTSLLNGRLMPSGTSWHTFHEVSV